MCAYARTSQSSAPVTWHVNCIYITVHAHTYRRAVCHHHQHPPRVHMCAHVCARKARRSDAECTNICSPSDNARMRTVALIRARTHKHTHARTRTIRKSRTHTHTLAPVHAYSRRSRARAHDRGKSTNERAPHGTKDVPAAYLISTHLHPTASHATTLDTQRSKNCRLELRRTPRSFTRTHTHTHTDGRQLDAIVALCGSTSSTGEIPISWCVRQRSPVSLTIFRARHTHSQIKRSCTEKTICTPKINAHQMCETRPTGSGVRAC